jgi:hypothetical protein
MSRSIRRVRLVTAVVTCIGVAGFALVATIAPAGGAAPTTEPASTVEDSTTSGVPAFTDGADARLAAEELIGAYIESQFGVAVSDAACSVPATGAVGDEFVCYALKPDNLVIALRASVGPQRLIELELLFDQPPATTAPAGQDTATTGG